ncbi:SEC14-like protein 2 isoform X2 [Parasteatoda tepidariorum]|nr:SEC14-like protein 2 isoform X2 [Parasteatoda tepidariorum]XP_042905287.1 SEC14-like protein 2 isoform X2 [Parasteatoda tepidariorum]
MTQSEDIVVDEEAVINELRKRMKNELPPNIYDDTLMLHNFLTARNFNLDQAEAMLRKHLQFRKELQLDHIVKDYKPPEVVVKYMPQSHLGIDKEGHLIRYLPLGNVDGRGLFRSANAHDVLKFCMQVIQGDVEEMKRISTKTGKVVSKCVYIYNLEHMTLAKATHKKSIEYYLQGLSIFQDNFPEILKSVYIVNASVYFTMVFSVVQRMLSGSILSKIHVYGTDGWKEKLLEIIPDDVLPAFLGGSRTDPDGNPFCNTFVEHAGIIPEKYFLNKNFSELRKKPDGRIVTVNAHSAVEVPVYVDNPKSVIKFEFESSKQDIYFGLKYTESKESKQVDVIPLHRIETNYKPEKKVYRCNKAGTYTFVFDNSNSWFNAKQVYYKIKVLSTKEFEGC